MKHLTLYTLLFLLLGSSMSAQKSLQPEDVFSLTYVSDPAFSPDGDFIAFLKNGFDLMTDRKVSDVWLVKYDGAGLRPLSTSEAQESHPIWSFEGDRLAWISSQDGEYRLMVRWMESGEQAPVATFHQKPNNLSWSPDGAWIAYSAFVPEKATRLDTGMEKPEGANWSPSPTYTEEIVYRRDGLGELETGHRQLFVMPANGGGAVQLTEAPFDHGGQVSWSPDSRYIYFSANLKPDNHLSDNPRNQELYRIEIASGKQEKLTDTQRFENAPARAPDGSMLAWTGFEFELKGYRQNEVYLAENNKLSEARVLTTDLDRSVGHMQWSPEGDYLWYQYTDEGMVNIGRVGMSGKPEKVASGLTGSPVGRPYAGGDFSVGPGGRYAFSGGDATHPAELYVGQAGGEKPRQLTDFNKALLMRKQPGKVEPFWTESSFDGRKVQGWIMYPPNFDPGKKYPLLLEIHGGPWAAYGDHFSMELQQYAARGYVVVYTNPRGSTSYGQEFADLIQHNYPGQDYDDLMSCVDEVIERGFIDESKLFVTGGSGGGVLSAWIVGKTDRFAAAVVAKPVINWFSHILTADAPEYWSRFWMPAMPWEDPEHYLKQSPISLVGNVKTPTMLMVGDKDYRTPLSESEQFYRALKLRGVPTALVRFPEASHYIAARPSQMLAKVSAVMSWNAKYGGPKANAATKP